MISIKDDIYINGNIVKYIFACKRKLRIEIMDRIYLKKMITAQTWLMIIIILFIDIFYIYRVMSYCCVANNYNSLNVFFIILLLWIFPIIKIRLDKSQSLSYDDDAIYQKITNLFGFDATETIIRYDDIYQIIGDPGRIINFGIMPFEFIRVIRKNWDGKELFAISPFFLNKYEMKDFVNFIYFKVPEAFSQEVIDYLKSDRL